jgi:hypothetical protein
MKTKDAKKPLKANREFTKKTKINVIKKKTSIAVMKNKLNPYGCEYCGDYSFSCGNVVPIFEVSNIHALNQIIGYAKFINKSYGNVYYRGECKLHNSLIPSLFRGVTNTSSAAGKLNSLIETVCTDKHMMKQLKLDENDKINSALKVEGVLQHYGIKTRFLDIVDNHWIALWMGLNRNVSHKQICSYNHYEEREIPLIDFANGVECTEEELFQYILLVAIQSSQKNTNDGIYVSENFSVIDLRQALPSTYIRPHAQHGLVVRKNPHTGNKAEDYDIASNVVGIIKIRIDRAKQWLGNGSLLSQNNLFPPPSFDNGYDVLLDRTDLFSDQFKIARYI